MKRKILLLFIVTLIVSLGLVRSKVYEIENVEYELFLDGNAITSFPSKGAYQVNSKCDNGVGVWDYDNWKFKIKKANTSTVCYVNFATQNTHVAFSDYIISLTDGVNVYHEVGYDAYKDRGYHYQGANPNNYVLFNNELWRVIGVYNQDSHGVANTNLVKIMRAEPLGNYIFDNDTSVSTNGNNDYSTSDLMHILNDYYLTSTNGNSSEHCYTFRTTQKGKCDFTSNGLNATAQSMIANVDWIMGGGTWVTSTVTLRAMYAFERAKTVYAGNSYTWSGKVAIPYASDFGYSTMFDQCLRGPSLNMTVSTFMNENCAGTSWMLNNSQEWTLTQNTETSYGVYMFTIYSSISYQAAYNSAAVRPTVYLSNNTYILGGTGTRDDPFVIGI